LLKHGHTYALKVTHIVRVYSEHAQAKRDMEKYVDSASSTEYYKIYKEYVDDDKDAESTSDEGAP
jgi:hypothetical protein